MLKIFRCFIIFVLVLISPISAFSQQNEQSKSSTDIKSIQTRVFDKPFKQVFRVIVNVLQDNKYKINFTDMSAGVITAKGTPSASENISETAALIPFIGGFLSLARQEKTEFWTVSVTAEDVDDAGKQTHVRLVITSEISTSGFGVGSENKLTNNDMTSKPEIYQDLFKKIETALFIRDALK